MERMNQCHKCKRTIHGRMIYAGGWVWHPSCYPGKIRKIKRKARSRRKGGNMAKKYRDATGAKNKRKFGKQTFKLLSGVYTKNDADRYAGSLREKGRLVRVVKAKRGVYRVYAKF